MAKSAEYTEVITSKYVHGGQALGQLGSGKKVLVWGALPGEKIRCLIIRHRRDFAEAVTVEVLDPSHDRVEPRDELYMSTSPWQILNESVEDYQKQLILKESMSRAGVPIACSIDFHKTTTFWNYRNKMEYSFYGDDDGLHLALYDRGTHRKRIVTGSSLAIAAIDEASRKITDVLHSQKVRAAELKSLIVRVDQAGNVAAALFTKNPDFTNYPELNEICNGLTAVFSNPKSPASVRTRDLYNYGDVSLCDRLLSASISYDVFSFFQVNIPVFTAALRDMKQAANGGPIVDMYSGVGTIGLALGSVSKLIEVDESNIEWAQNNAQGSSAEVVKARSEEAASHLDSGQILVVDPPRAGLHETLTAAILDKKPKMVMYLSCNPSTQARDLEKLQAAYRIDSLKGYNFFPRTPHIESLAILVRK